MLLVLWPKLFHVRVIIMQTWSLGAGSHSHPNTSCFQHLHCHLCRTLRRLLCACPRSPQRAECLCFDHRQGAGNGWTTRRGRPRLPVKTTAWSQFRKLRVRGRLPLAASSFVLGAIITTRKVRYSRKQRAFRTGVRSPRTDPISDTVTASAR